MTDLPMLRQSERGAFKRCQWMWYQRYVLKLVPIVQRMDAADFGTLFHMALEAYYIPGKVRGPHPAETWDRLARDKIATIKCEENVNGELVAKWEDFHPLGLELAEAYVDRYQGDPHWDVLDAERRFSVVIPDVRVSPLVSEKGRRGYKPIVRLVGTIDLCVRDLNEETKYGPVIKMVDHKTVRAIPQVGYLKMDEQASTYITVATHALREQKLIGPKEVVNGMEYNYIRRGKMYKEPLKEAYLYALEKAGITTGIDSKTGTGKPIEKLLKTDLAQTAERHNVAVYGEPNDIPTFLRHYVPRTSAERQRQIVRISEEARTMADIRAGRLPILKSPTRECQWCPYYDLCELDETGGDAEYFISTTMTKVDPYEDHYEGANNSKKVGENGCQVEG